MPTLTVAARNAAADAIVDLIDGGSGSYGDIAFLDSSDTVLCVCNMSNPAFGSASNGTATANSISNGTVSTSGTIAKVKIRDTDDNEVMECTITVTGGGGEFEIGNLTVSSGDTISVTSFTVTMPAS